MGTSPNHNASSGLARRAGRAARWLLLALLDTRSRWWLSRWVCIPLGMLMGTVSLIGTDRLGGTGGGSRTGVFIYVVDGEFVTQAPPGNVSDEAVRTANLSYGYSIEPTRWTISYSATAGQSNGPHQHGPVLTDEECRRLLAGYTAPPIDAPDRMPGFARRDLQAWAAKAYPEMMAAGDSIRTTRPTARVLAYWLALQAYGLMGIGVIVVALVSWFLRGAQIGHYKRALRRHEAGHCPLCNYDISAAPELPCPECGCDHRAVRREAVAALKRAPKSSTRGTLAAKG